MRILAALLALLLAAGSAVAQPLPPPAGPIVFSIAADHSSGGTPQRPNLVTTTLTPSVTTSNVWENWYANLSLNGPGTASGEINVMHPVFTVNSGATASSGEVLEASIVNSGIIGALVGVLSLPNNQAAGTATTLYAFKSQLTNANATAGAITTFAGLDCETLSGGGSTPTNNYCIRNGDSGSWISTNGNIGIGTLAQNANRLFIAGADNSAATFSIMFKNQATTITFAVNNAGGILTNGVGSVSCAANSVVLATLVVTNGIVTHC